MLEPCVHFTHMRCYNRAAARSKVIVNTIRFLYLFWHGIMSGIILHRAMSRTLIGLKKGKHSWNLLMAFGKQWCFYFVSFIQVHISGLQNSTGGAHAYVSISNLGSKHSFVTAKPSQCHQSHCDPINRHQSCRRSRND